MKALQGPNFCCYTLGKKILKHEKSGFEESVGIDFGVGPGENVAAGLDKSVISGAFVPISVCPL
ncbi:MAG: hypothetical protein ACFBSG_05875 [Leptolyngbyaceae cyanobacterium]